MWLWGNGMSNIQCVCIYIANKVSYNLGFNMPICISLLVKLKHKKTVNEKYTPCK